MKVGEFEVPDNLKFSKDHEWALAMPDGRVKVGITDFAVKQLKDLVFLELKPKGTSLRPMESAGTIESIKSVSEILSPVGGTIDEINGDAVSDPGIVASDPYQKGWLLIVKPVNAAEDMSKLLSPADYGKHIQH